MQCTPEEIEAKRKLAREKLDRNRSNLERPEAQQSSPNKFRFVSKDSKGTYKHNEKPYERPFEAAKPTFSVFSKEKTVTGKCSLLTETRFVVELSGFNEAAISVFKTIPSRNYDSKTRNWDFHIQDHASLITKLEPLRPTVTVEKLPNFVINLTAKARNDFSDIDLSRIETELGSTLMPFQQDAVRFGIDKNGRCLIADDMGLGKTFQALGIASYYSDDWPVLIVTTSSMKNVWEETIYRYLPSVPVIHVQYMSTGKDYIGESKILIVSHDLMSRTKDRLLERRFGVLIIDESHTVKNFKAKVTRVALELSKKARRVILLSGTPALSRPSELFSQLQLLDYSFFGTFYDYSRRYCDGKSSHFGWDASGKSNLQELEIILKRKFMIRRTKEDVLKALPNKTQEVVTLDVNLDQLSDVDRTCLQTLASRFQSEKKGNQKHAFLLTFFSETGRIKIPSVCSYVLQLLKTNQKFIIFAHHHQMLDAICVILRKKETKFIRIDGNSSSEQRKYFVDKFQLDDNYRVAVLSITAACAGITLTAAQLVVFAELHWNPSILSQAESRAHRIGQEHPVIVRYLLAPKTADDSIWPMLQEKQKILGEAGLCKDTFDNVSVVDQSEVTDTLTADLNVTTNRTCVGTLDISSYFEDLESDKTFKESSSIFDDGLDDIFSTMEC